MNNKKRFFGLHFDFHADNDTEIGGRTNAEDIQWYIDEAKPGFIQCDCKGHRGNSSYPTKVGKPADKIVKDNLKIWCEVAKKNNLPIFMHYSGVWDAEYTKKHPDQAAVDKDGNITEKASLFGDYAEKLLIPQIKELITDYEIDGVWIDGDNWAVERDFSKLAKPYLKEKMTETEHNEIMRKAFIKYVKKYVDELHEFAPDFMIISNWMNTSYMPEKPEVELDYISGDYPHNNSVHRARHEGRCIAARKKPWDLMAWSFEWTHHAEKPAVQLMQEAAMVLMLGGGFQLYIPQNKDGSAKQNRGARLRKIGEFVNRRQMLFEKKTIAQVGVLYSADSYYEKSNIYNAAGATKALIGTLNAILDVQYTANVVYEYQLDELDEYEIVVVPEWDKLSEETISLLKKYVECGGNAVVIGAQCITQFNKSFGEPIEYQQLYMLDEDGNFCGITNEFMDEKRWILNLSEGEERLFERSDLRDESYPAYRIDNFGKGRIAWIPFAFGTDYFVYRTYIHMNFMKRILSKLAKPRIEINSKMIDVSIQEEEKGVIVNLLNMNQGRHSLDILIYDEIAPIKDVEIAVSGEYNSVRMPLGEKFEVKVENGTTKIYLEKLDIHSIIELKNKA